MNTIPYSQGHFGVRLIQPEREFICVICGKPGITRGKGTQAFNCGYADGNAKAIDAAREGK